MELKRHSIIMNFPSPHQLKQKIEHVKQKFANMSDHRHLTLEGIGKEAGFTSRSVFFSEFKKHTGLSPGEYLKKINK